MTTFMEPRSGCPICNSDIASYGEVSGYPLNKCNSCRHVWLRDLPTAEDLAKFYNTNESMMWNSGTFSILRDYSQNPNQVGRYYSRERTRRLEEYCGSKFSNVDTTVLDIGCGTGVFLASLRDRGLKVKGYDLSESAVSRGVHDLGLELISGSIEAGFSNERFDIITCYDVIEHSIDPRQIVRAIKRYSTSSSDIIIRTPNHASFLRMITGSKWLWYMPPAHIHHFSPQSLTLLLEQEGFTVQKVRTLASTYLYFLAYYLMPSSTGAGTGKSYLNMPRWKEVAINGLDKFLRICLAPVLVPARFFHGDALLEIHAKRSL